MKRTPCILRRTVLERFCSCWGLSDGCETQIAEDIFIVTLKETFFVYSEEVYHSWLELAELCSLWPEFVCSVHAVTRLVCFRRYVENVKLLSDVVKKNTAEVKYNILQIHV